MNAEDSVFGFFLGGFLVQMFITFWDRAVGRSPKVGGGR